MQSGWRIGALFGIPLFIDPSWFAILILLTLLMGQSFGAEYQHWNQLLVWTIGFATSLLLFVSVLCHELGHSLVALSQGIRVKSITLFLFGGVASIDQESKTPGQAFQVAIAGPAVSLILFGLFTLLAQQLPVNSPSAILTDEVAHINLVLALFNLIPGLPLDGGQVLKSLVWKLTQNRFTGVHWAASTGRFLGYGAMLLGLAVALTSNNVIAGLWFGLLGWFGIRTANSYDQVTTLQESLITLTAAQAMQRNFRVVNAEMTLQQFAEHYLLDRDLHDSIPPLAYYAASQGRYRGIIVLEDFRAIERSLWSTQTLQEIAQPLLTIPTVSENTSLGEVINSMEAEQLAFLTVLSPAGSVAGVIDRGDILRRVAEHLNWLMPETQIQQVKKEGHYPPGLQLDAIAESIRPELQARQSSKAC